MGLFNKHSNGPAPYPVDDQEPFANDTSGLQPPHSDMYPSISRPPTSFSQTSTMNGDSYPYSDPSVGRTATSFPQSNKRYFLKAETNNRDFKIKGKDTEYIRMLLHQTQEIEKRPYWNILAAALTWILLAGFIVLPGTYPGLQNSKLIEEAKKDQSNLGNIILEGITPRGIRGLLIVACSLCGLGSLGIVGLWLKWRSNYIWLMNKLLLPALLNCFMGLLSTLVNVLSKPDKVFTDIAIATTAATGGLTLILACTFLVYNYLLEQVKADHRDAYKDQESQDPKDAIFEKYGEHAMV